PCGGGGAPGARRAGMVELRDRGRAGSPSGAHGPSSAGSARGARRRGGARRHDDPGGRLRLGGARGVRGAATAAHHRLRAGRRAGLQDGAAARRARPRRLPAGRHTGPARRGLGAVLASRRRNDTPPLPAEAWEPSSPPAAWQSAAAAPLAGEPQREAASPTPPAATEPPSARSEPSASAPAAAAPSAALAGSLSDGDVERIARKVVELLGERVVRDVAWEVIPDMAEVVIKDRLRELEAQVE